MPTDTHDAFVAHSLAEFPEIRERVSARDGMRTLRPEFDHIGAKAACST